MNKVEMQSAVNAAMANDNIVDAQEMRSIIAQVAADHISSFEINNARSLLVDSNKEVAADARTVRHLDYRIKNAIKDLNAPEGIAALRQKATADQALATATNRRDAYATLASSLATQADPDVRRTADQFWDAGRGLDHAGHVIVNGAQDVGDRVGSAVTHIGDGIGSAIHDLFGHH